ncbi:MAG: VanZ family protein [Paludibacteraceae bacterium]|nr:VanZ family protein [Paludibacteraceae bacterium]
MSNGLKSYTAYIPAVVMAAGIAVVSLIERPQEILDIRASDKVLHGLMYALLGLAAMWGAFQNGHSRWHAFVAVIAVVTVYGGCMEWMQYACTETRSGEWADVAADLAGAIAGTGVAGAGRWLWKKHIHTTLR